MAVGQPPLHGLLICGQFEITAMRSISARSSTKSPGFDGAASKIVGASALSSPTGTLQKKFRFATMSLRPRPCFANSVKKFSQHPETPLTPYRISLLRALQHPANRVVEATTVAHYRHH